MAIRAASDKQALVPDAGQVRLPGSEGIWTFVFMDMLVFALIFLVFGSERIHSPALYSAGQTRLNGWFGLANTLILLTSSWVMVGAVQARRIEDITACRARLMGVLALGCSFCALKAFEYFRELETGFQLLSGSFVSMYFFITGLHIAHLVGTMIFIVSMRAQLDGAVPVPIATATVENVALFWHFVDIVWIFIFPLLYLIGLP